MDYSIAPKHVTVQDLIQNEELGFKFGTWVLKKFSHEEWLDKCRPEDVASVLHKHSKNGTSPTKTGFSILLKLFKNKLFLEQHLGSATSAMRDIADIDEENDKESEEVPLEKSHYFTGEVTDKVISTSLKLNVSPQAIEAARKRSHQKLTRFLSGKGQIDCKISDKKIEQILENAVEFYVDLMWETKSGIPFVKALEEAGIISQNEIETREMFLGEVMGVVTSEAYVIAHLFKKLFSLSEGDDIAGEAYVRLFLEADFEEDNYLLNSFQNTFSYFARKASI